ncbi:HD domain-containing protein [Cohnella pontilimi]|uniref:HD domain-containing protein n=1 Tax=Cohnella pontilimi TaxID=2564100 RepID=A0A4U0FCG5_9BACL|nr:HD domain-containing phosphohydrolase [Cohnella pontilimi]TJY41914.1 HD domain-containing protein [Cohnella pontilimi]
MREVPITHLVSGDVLSRPVYARSGAVMLEAGTVLTEAYINRLKLLNIQRVFLRLKRTPLQEPEWVMPDINSIKNDENARMDAVQTAVGFAESPGRLESISPPIAIDKFRDLYRDLIGEIVSNRQFAEEMGVMLRTDPLLFRQALQVSMYAGIIGTAKNFDSAQMYELTLGALFSDIGMTRLPTDLIKLGRELTEAERLMVRRHTTEGYRILTKIKGMPLESAKVALQHHERYRGEGYPFGLTQKEISEFAQIVGLSDVYNALISPRHYRKAYAPEEATEYLFASGNYEFELSLIQTFLRHHRVYPASTVVQLSNGQTAYVVDTMNRPLLRPVVQIIREADGSAVPSPYLVDLEKEPYLAILRRIGDV